MIKPLKLDILILLWSKAIIFMCVFERQRKRERVCVCARACVCVCVYACMRVCVCVCTCMGVRVWSKDTQCTVAVESQSGDLREPPV